MEYKTRNEVPNEFIFDAKQYSDEAIKEFDNCLNYVLKKEIL